MKHSRPKNPSPRPSPHAPGRAVAQVQGFNARTGVGRILPASRLRELLIAARRARLLVVGDVMLDQFIWGEVSRISPEAPVPVVNFLRESHMPGGAANVARNLTAFGARVELAGAVGRDPAGSQLQRLLKQHRVGYRSLIPNDGRPTTVKTRIVAHQQQVVRIDRETRQDLSVPAARRLLRAVRQQIRGLDAVIVADYGKGVVTQLLLNELKPLCRDHGVWLSLDPKPVQNLNLAGLSLITPNRKEAFELARLPDDTRNANPLADASLLRAAECLTRELSPAMLLVTLGEQGMLLCQRGAPPFHIPTVAQDVYDVSGAGDTVNAVFTLAIVAGASPVEAAILANHAAGVVVGKIGTAICSPAELSASFQSA